MGLFKSDTVQVAHDISVVYSPQAGSQIIELVHNNPNQIRDKFGLKGVPGVANAFLEELRCYASINSLPEVGLPDITRDDSESEKLTKAQNFEWKTARFELVVFKKAKNQADWAEFGVSALKNSGGFRYRIHRILDLITDNIGARVGEWGKIGVAIRSVGYSYPASFDRISFTGHWLQEFTWVQEHPTYVIVNSYGGGGSSPTPTPTPTPAPAPTFTLSLAQGKTSAVASNNDSIILTITNIAAGNGVSATWLKNGTATTATEPISTTSSNIHLLSTSKLAALGAGNYSLKITYGGVEYTTNAVSVTLLPQVTLVTTATQSGNLNFFIIDGQTYEFAIQGLYFTPGPATFAWFRGETPATLSPSPGVNNPITGTVTIGSDGSFTLNKASSSATFTSYYDNTNKEGSYRIKITQNGVDTWSNAIYGANKVGVPSFSPDTVSMAGSTPVTVNISGFAVGQSLNIVWLKNNLELLETSSQHTYAENAGNAFLGYYYSFTVPAANFANSPYGGAGSYKLKVSRPGTPIAFTSANPVTITA